PLPISSSTNKCGASSMERGGLASPSHSSSLLSIRHCPRHVVARKSVENVALVFVGAQHAAPLPISRTTSNPEYMRPVLCLVIVLVSPLAAQEPFDFYSRGPYRPAVPRPDAITGYPAGSQHTMYA